MPGRIIFLLLIQLLLFKSSAVAQGENAAVKPLKVIHDTVYVYKKKKKKPYINRQFNNSGFFSTYIILTYKIAQDIHPPIGAYDIHSISYTRRVYEQLFLRFNYCQWIGAQDGGASHSLFSVPVIMKGSIINTSNFRYTDILIGYNLKLHKRHQLQIGAGVSYTNGGAFYVDSASSPYPNHYDHISGHDAQVSWAGMSGIAGYNYLLFNNRLFLGTEIVYRKYFNSPFEDQEWGLHFGINF